MRCGASRDQDEGTAEPAQLAERDVLSASVAIPAHNNSMGLISSYNIRSMTVRKGTAAMTAMGIAMVVAVFVMTMAIAQGFNGALVASGSNDNAILLRKGATSETVSAVLRPQLPLIEAMPQVARANGHVLASPELVV